MANLSFTFYSRAALALLLVAPLTACELEPGDPSSAAQMAFANGEPRTAFDLANQALEIDPGNVAIRMLAGDAAMALSMPDRAIDEFKRVPETAAQYSSAQAKMAQGQLAGGYLERAGETLEGLTMDNPHAFAAQALYLSARGEPVPANEAVAKGLQAYPQDPMLITMNAQRLWSEGKIDAAHSSLKPALALEPAFFEAHLFAGQLHLSQRRVAEAKSHFELALSARPNEQVVMLSLAAIANDTGDSEEGRQWLNRAAERSAPSSAWVLLAVQMAYEAGDTPLAMELIEQAPREMAGAPQFLRLRGVIDASRDQHALAALYLGDYVEETGGDIATRQLLARSLGEEGQFQEAWEVIAPVIDHPQMGTAGLSIALQLAKRVSPSDAEDVRGRLAAVQSGPDISEQMQKAGKAIRAGDFAGADAIFAPLLDEQQNNPALLNNAAAVKTLLGKHSEAIAIARRAIAAAPTSPEIQDTLGWALWQGGGDKAEAQQWLQKAREGAPSNREIAEHWAIANAR